ncbi:MAG TPA: RagB/SusD family nutrient uptake outer membrane protein [Saprospiraceae bacterium]|nr:RagB/SusD family nutrient uptake outer membrane protein [Saprospiraceae bacterium]HQW94365.1 RagB/SusD family nutrient uptake outer membrane protein [Saprospiraceae bacterium]HRG43070.1 RagB/SusD family nutrient uptake outer membrane protein [Saprospiraceae bacterium]
MRNILLFFAFIGFLTSCDVLDVEPTNSIPASEAFKTKGDVERGVLGAYNSLQALSYYGRTYITFSDLASDNYIHPLNATSTEYAEIDNNHILPENASVDGMWTSIYDGLNVANNVISKIPTLNFLTQEEKNKALGELYFLRALNHFNLLNYFGGVPLKLKPTVGLSDINAARNSVDEVYQSIIEDLTFASQNLSNNSSLKNRASQSAANALLARVYLYKKDYNNAALYASKVINEGGYSLLDNYGDIFATDESKESIFEVDFTPLDRNRIAEYNFPLTKNGRGEVAPDPAFVSSYSPNDTRYAATFAFSGNVPYVIKYDDLSTGSDNIIVLRLAEMYLIRAEANAKLNGNPSEILADINRVRQRAGLADLTTNNVNELIVAIETERRFELAFEGQRWFDLVRTGRAIDVLPNVNENYQLLFPIPQSELLTNTNPGMKQNPGY